MPIPRGTRPAKLALTMTASIYQRCSANPYRVGCAISQWRRLNRGTVLFFVVAIAYTVACDKLK